MRMIRIWIVLAFLMIFAAPISAAASRWVTLEDSTQIDFAVIFPPPNLIPTRPIRLSWYYRPLGKTTAGYGGAYRLLGGSGLAVGFCRC